MTETIRFSDALWQLICEHAPDMSGQDVLDCIAYAERELITHYRESEPQELTGVNTTRLDSDQLEALRRVVAYLWQDEQRDYVTNASDDHIFKSLLALHGYLDQQGTTVFPEPAWYREHMWPEAQ